MTESIPQKDPNNLTGRQVGQFTVLEEIGRGGMATVYRATQQSINRDVALKVLPRTFLHDPNFLERFSREVELVAHLEHPHIVPIYDYGQAEGMPYIAMRYLAGGTFRRLAREGVSDLRDLIRPVSQVAQALDHAHNKGIIHRDLKPDNVLLDTSGNAYLSDFGIARVLNSNLTGSAIIGTPTYMSPEQANSEPLDPRSDVYALGIVVFELITGREPFQAATPMAMLLKQINERVPSLTEYRRNIPEALDRVVAKATEKDRNDRYNTAGEMVVALEAALAALDGPLTVAGWAGDDNLPATEPMDAGARRAPRLTPTTDLDGATVTPATDDITRERVRAAQAATDGPATMATPAPINPNLDPQRRGGPANMWAYSAVALVLLVLAGVGLVVVNPFASPPPLAESVPVYATGVQVVDNTTYALGIPPGFAAVAAMPGEPAQWANADATATLSAQVVPLDGRDFATAAVAYMDGYADAQLISTSEGAGYQRFSLRLAGDDATPPGQADLFMAPVREEMLVVTVFTADTAPPESVQTLQAALQSVRVPAG